MSNSRVARQIADDGYDIRASFNINGDESEIISEVDLKKKKGKGKLSVMADMVKSLD